MDDYNFSLGVACSVLALPHVATISCQC